MMSKSCAICGNKIGFMDQNIKLRDGYICESCYKQVGLAGKMGPSMAAISWGETHVVADVQAAINAGITISPKAKNQQAKAESQAVDNARLDKIKKQFDDAHVSDLFGTKKEVKALPNILADDEIVQYATSGLVDANTVLMVLTNVRILFIDKGLIYGIKSTEIPLDMVNAVNYKKGMILGEISITNGAQTTLVQNVDKQTAPYMVTKIKEARAKFMQPKQVAPAAAPEKSIADQLHELKSLVDDGILTDDEFNAKKKQILGI